jgi:adsorption protein A
MTNRPARSMPETRPQPLGWHLVAGGLMALLMVPGPNANAAEEPERNWLQQQVDNFRAYPHLHRAYSHMKQNRLAEAEKELLVYLEIQPADVDARLSLLALLYKARNFSAVQYQATRTLVLDPGNPTALLYQGLAAQAQGRKAPALKLFRQVYSNPGAPDDARELAANSAYAIAFALKQFGEALEALGASPAGSKAFLFQMRKGAVLAALKRNTEAKSFYASALSVAGNGKERANAASALGLLAQRQGDMASALSYGEVVLAVDPDNLTWLRITADIHFGRKEYPLAERLARRVLALTNESGDRFYLANVLFAEQNFDDAAAEYSTVANGARDKFMAERANVSLGYTEQARQRPDAARQAFEKAVALNRKSEAARALAALQDQSASAAAVQPGPGAGLPALLRHYRLYPTGYTAATLGYRYAQSGDAAAAASYFNQALRRKEEVRWRIALADQLARAGSYAAASDALKTLRTVNDEQRREVAEIYRHIGQPAKSAAYREQLAAPTNTDRLRLAEDYIALKTPARALAQIDAIARTGGAGAPALRAAGYLHTEMGDDARAVAAFRKALAAGDTELQTRKALAYLLDKGDDRQAALDEHLAVLKREAAPENEVAVARAYARLNQNQQALSHYRSALAATADGDVRQLAALNAEIGNVYESDKDYGAAHVYWEKAAAAADSPELEIQLAYAEEVLGKPEQARARLSNLKFDKMSSASRLVLLDQFARLNRATGDIQVAAQYTDMALAIEPNADRYYQRALDSLRLQQKEAGRVNLEKAMELAPDNPEFALQLAYLHKQEGSAAAAIPLFEKALQLDPSRSNVYADLAYANVETGSNQEALGWFHKAIDDKAAALGGEQASNPQLYGMRQQVRAMTQGYRFDVYQSYRPSSGSGAASVVPGFVSGGVIPSQGGAELLYQPENAGYNNGRVLRFFGRSLWSNRPGSMRIDPHSVQGGVGLEYKPLGDENIYLGVERLFPIGRDALSNWLLRASWGYSNGYDLRPDQDSWNQTILYADAGYLAQHDKTRSLYFEGRQGWVKKIGSALMVTPHVMAAARGQRPDPFKVSYVEAGAGVSLKYLFNESKYSAPRSSLEFVLQYRKQVAGSRHHGGWVLSAAGQF